MIFGSVALSEVGYDLLATPITYVRSSTYAPIEGLVILMRKAGSVIIAVLIRALVRHRVFM